MSQKKANITFGKTQSFVLSSAWVWVLVLKYWTGLVWSR